MDERTPRFRLHDITPLTYANETCAALIARAEKLLDGLDPTARVTRIKHDVKSTPLWARVFTWVEYAQRGHAETPALLKQPPPIWDDRMTDVIRAVEARKALAAGECVSTAQIALLAGISHIQVGNYVRNNRLEPDSQDSSGYLFAAKTARAFLIEREVPGFPRRKKLAS